MQKIIVLDTETTGLDNPHAFEVAASLCEFQDGKLTPVAQYHQLFNPNKEIEPAANEHIIAGGTYEDVFINDEYVEYFVLNIKHKIQDSNWMVRNILKKYVDFCFDWFDGKNYKTV